MSSGSTANVAAGEPYVTEFDATVESVDGYEVRLDQTYFYAEGGGQPADRGTLGGIAVSDVQTHEGTTVHALATEPKFEAGDTVAGAIDDEFRTYCMRAHTAGHLLYGAGRRVFGDHGYGGFDIGPEKARLDFEIDHNSADVDAIALERLANEAIWESRGVSWREMETDRARERDEIVFNVTDETALRETVRVVEIEGWDIAACGGTHVRNTHEIGPVTVLDVSNPGADLVRVEYAVGPTAVRERVDETRAATRAAQTLDASVADLPERAATVVETNESLEAEVERLREQLLEDRLEALAADSISKDGDDWIVGELAVDGVGANDVSDRVRELAGEAGDVIAVTGVDGRAFVVVGTTGETDASEIVEDVTATFGGGGGGGTTFAQGGGIDAEPSALVEYLRDRT